MARALILALALAGVVAVGTGIPACGSDKPASNDGSTTGSAGMTGGAGAAGGAGTTGGGGSTGAAGRGGTSGSAGTTGRGGTTGGGGSGTQPIGAVCVNSGNCSQADGTAVCCLQISTCVLDTQCPSGTTYVSCENQPCSKAGWVCCNSGGMHFCTKQSACGN